MRRLDLARLVIAGIGLIVWGYGTHAGEPITRLVGIGVFAVALLLRFARPRERDGDDVQHNDE